METILEFFFVSSFFLGHPAGGNILSGDTATHSIWKPPSSSQDGRTEVLPVSFYCFHLKCIYYSKLAQGPPKPFKIIID